MLSDIHAQQMDARAVRRNSSTIDNVAYLERPFHDGRECSLEQQVWGPLLAHNELSNPAVGQVIDKISTSPAFRDRFKAASQ